MEEVKLKKKVTLRRKQEEVAFTFGGQLKVNLYWSSKTDLDLCIFFRKKNGEVGGVFSNEYRNKRSDLGSRDNFPYILHLGDNKEPAPGGEDSEQINIYRLDDIDEAFICVLNYAAAIEGEDVTYAQESGRIELKSDSSDYLEVLADSSESGHVYSVCSIKNKDGQFTLKKEDQVMSLGKAFDEIPGFELICN